MKVIITGGKGQLGTDLNMILKEKNFKVFPFSSSELDISDINKFLDIAKNIKPDVIINCAAFTHVDNCEKDQEKAFLINALGAKNCAIVSDFLNCKLIHISTDYVFNGLKTSPYTEYDQAKPLSIYAKTKLYGEHFIKEHCNKFFILRVAGVYGANGNNFVKTIINFAKSKKSLKVVKDQITTPTYTIDICNEILQLIDCNNFGLYHATSEGECSWYEFTKFIFNQLNITTEVIPCTTEEFPRPAKRPAYSVLENYNLKLQNLNVMRHWQESIADFLKTYMQEPL